MKTIIKVSTALTLLIVLFGCSLPTNKPLETLEYASPVGAATSGKHLMILLRGRGGSHQTFEEYGFIRELESRGIDYKVAAPNTHFGYFMSRMFVERLKTDIIEPAKNAGYERIWLTGVSLGGLGSMLYAKTHPEDIDGMFLIAPYVGEDAIIEEIKETGGPLQWDPGEFDPQKEWQRDLWAWLQDYPKNPDAPAMYLGYGLDDRFAAGHQLFDNILPKSQIIAIDGVHKFTTFSVLWSEFLDLKVLPQ